MDSSAVDAAAARRTTATASTTTTAELLAHYWKDDFVPLQAAGVAINTALRADEQGSDLYRRICNGDRANSHLYFPAKTSPQANTTTTTTTTTNAIVLRTNPGTNGSNVGREQPPLVPPAVTLTPPPMMELKHHKTVPLPRILSDHLAKVKIHSGMGLLAAAGLAWMSVDEKLYLWPYQTHNATSGYTSSHEAANPSSFFTFTVPSGQCVVTVGLVRPKKGVFKANVEWCVVIATPDEVIMCVLARSNASPSISNAATMPHSVLHGSTSAGFVMVPTCFALLTEGTRVLAIAGTELGRIFLGGDDGCLYEMTYLLDSDVSEDDASRLSISERLDQFYDGDEILPDTIVEDASSESFDPVNLGKRAWSTLKTVASVSDASSHRRRKCAKINRTDTVPSLVKAVVPDFVLRGTSFIFGGGTSAGGVLGGKIVQMVVDEERKTLFTLSSEGWIGVFDWSVAANLRLAAVMDGPRTARLYLEAVSRGQGFPPSHTSSTIGTISFPGGSASAQAGVGGMDGARAILKQDDIRRSGNTNGSTRTPNNMDSSILKPTSIHLISTTESSRLTLVAVSEGGLRMYLSSLSAHVISNGPHAPVVRRYGSANSFVSRNPLAPSSRLTLCHIRAPPPLSQNGQTMADLTGDFSNGVVGAIAPRVAGNSHVRVHAAMYNQGVFVAALMENEVTNGRGGINEHVNRPKLGDIIVATCPDVVERRVETPVGVLEKTRDMTKDTKVVLGGITESKMLPMSSAHGVYDARAKLQGGIVWDITEVLTKVSSISFLSSNSTTPSESELGVGLPRVYDPKLTQKSIGQSKNYDFLAVNGRNVAVTSSNSIIPLQSPIFKNSIKGLGNVVANLLLSRPIRFGLTFESGDLDSAKDREKQSSYRISSRDSSKGFSPTASEMNSRVLDATSARSNILNAKSSSRARAERLRSTILRPPTVPLNFLSTYFYPQSKEMVALNAGGLHFFLCTNVLKSLADALASANDNVGNDLAVTSFFKGYGYKEGCCMCLALAIGCGSVDSHSESLRNRASSAALARAYVPKLVAQLDQSNSPVMGVASNVNDPLVPTGYDFNGSALFDGLMTLASRLLRPVWHKPAVVVTEGRMVQFRMSTLLKQTPAKVELLLSEASLDELSTLLRNLLNVMKTVFSRAVNTVPGASRLPEHMMDIDDIGSDSLYLTSALQHRSQLRSETSGLALQLSALEAERIAQLIEEKNIHSLYRLLSRMAQLLNLFSLLSRAQYMVGLQEIEWGLLHGLTFSQLVQTPEGHGRLENLLNSLVTSSVFGLSRKLEVSAQADQLAHLFSDQCFLFFSPGSQFAYHGLRKASEALAHPVATPSRIALADEAVANFKDAAKYWCSAPLISGCIVRAQERQSVEQVARRAIQYGSPLAKAVVALMELEDVVGVVDVCLITADNFKIRQWTNRSKVETDKGRCEQPWERQLYHKSRDEWSQRKSGSSQMPPTSASSAIVEFGNELTGKDAEDTCYSLILYHISLLLSSDVAHLADKMVSRCVDSSDTAFLDKLFVHLHDNNHTEIIMKINSPSLEKWLQERKEPALLWSYYNYQGRHLEAGNLCFNIAKDVDSTLTLVDRIQWLSRSYNSYKTALGGQLGGLDFGTNEDVIQKAKEVSDSLEVAHIQSSILNTIQASEAAELSPEMFHKLSNTLLFVSELYNDFAAAFNLYDECLCILQTCRHDDVQTIQSLWKNIIWDEVTQLKTRDQATWQFLRNFFMTIGLDAKIALLQDTDPSDSSALVESGTWAKNVAEKVINLGKRLYGRGVELVFPVEFILRNLEALKQSVPSQLSPGWSMLTVADAGVPFLVILDAYDSVYQSNDRIFIGGVDMMRQKENAVANLEMMEYWLERALSSSRALGGQASEPLKELTGAMSSGRLMRKLDSITAKIDSVPDTASSLRSRLHAIEQKIYVNGRRS